MSAIESLLTRESITYDEFFNLIGAESERIRSLKVIEQKKENYELRMEVLLSIVNAFGRHTTKK